MTAPVCVFVDDPLPVELTEPARELGGKGLSLRRLSEASVRVPRGFTIRAAVCREFLASGDWSSGAWSAIEAALDRLGRQLLEDSAGASTDANRTYDPRLAVRSGAAVSMPGLLRTFLDVPSELSAQSGAGRCGESYPAVRAAIEQVCESWNSPAAERYRQQQRIDDQMATAVNVQEMIDCVASGVLFTRGDGNAKDTLVIEAVAGSGESLVSGRATPLEWIVRRDDRRLLRGPADSEDVPAGLIDAIPELIQVGLRLENDSGGPLDIEWGLDRDGLVFFQARSVAATESDNTSNVLRKRELSRLRTSATAGARCWVRHNLGETLPHPTPLTWSLWRQFMSGDGGLGSLYREIGFRPGRPLQGKSFLMLIGGQIYADPDRAVEMFSPAWPWSYDTDELRNDPALLDDPPRHFDVARLDPWFVWRAPALLWRMWRAQRRIGRLMQCAADEFEQQTVARILQFVDDEHGQCLADLDELALLRLFESRCRQVMDEFAPRSLLPGTLGGIALAELTRQVSSVLGPEVAEPLVRDITPAGEITLIHRQQELLARWDEPAAQTAFLEEFGHRAIGEMELAVPRWRETPELIGRMVAHQSSTPPTPLQPDQKLAHERLGRAFADAGAASLVAGAGLWLDRCWRLLPYRDRGKHIWLRSYELLRQVSQELSDRFRLGDDFYLLTPDEWPAVAQGADLRPMIDERRREADVFRRWHHPTYIDAGQTDGLFTTPPCRDQHKSLQGTPLSGGYAEGHVYSGSGFDGAAANALRVLVCETLEPSLVPLLTGTVAVIVQQGGTLSHGAILARQMGLPVVRLSDALRLLTAGQQVGVDGQTGRVDLLDRDPQ